MAFSFALLSLWLTSHFIKRATFKNTAILFVVTLVLLNVFYIRILPTLSSKKAASHKSFNEEKITNLSTLNERFIIWSKTYELIEQHFGLGVGANNWKVAHTKNHYPTIFKATDLNVIFQRPHNDFLWIFSEYGIIGLNSYLAWVLLVLLGLYTVYINTRSRLALLLFASLVSYWVISFFDFPKERIEHIILCSMLLSAAFGILYRHQYYKSKAIRVSKPRGILIVLVAVMISYISYQFLRGEKYLNKLYLARLSNDPIGVLRNGEKSISRFYNLDPTSVPVSWYRANALVELNAYEPALQELKTALKHAPFNPYVLNDLGSAYYYSEKTDSALYYYKQAAMINERFDDPRLNIVAIYINEEAWTEAKKWNESILHDSERRTYYRKLIAEREG